MVVASLAAVALAYSHARPQWEDLKVFQHDVYDLYAYVPAAFLYRDLSFAFVRDLPADFPGVIPLERTRGGDLVLKVSCGTAFLYAPFFLLAHGAAKVGGIPANGYSWIYQYFIALGAIVYAVAGLAVLRGVLLERFSDGVVALTLASVFAGTNLFYYTVVEGGMTHVYSFFLFALFARLTVDWHERPRWGPALGLGAVLGLVTLVRPSNVVVVLVFLLYRAGDVGTWREKLALIGRERVVLLCAMLVAFVVVTPQLAYWKYSTGAWVHWSYGDEGFFFSRPHIIEGLISYRKGLLVYTPIMTLAFAGMILLRQRRPTWFWPVVGFTAVNLYVAFSWWCWWYGGSFGQRALIESYAIWAMPMAAMIEWLLSHGRIAKGAAALAIAILVCLNLFQTEQYRRTLIHWDSMSRDAYWSVFLQRGFPANYAALLRPPDYDRARRGEDE